MHWGEPRAFLLFLLIPLLWFWYLRRGARREIEVSSLLLWKTLRAQAQILQRPKVRRLPPSFYCWSLSIAAVSLALARPALEGPAAPELWILLENSARMTTSRDDGKTRFDALRGIAIELLAACPADTRVRLSVFPGGPEEASEAPGRIRHALLGLQPTEAPCDLEEELARRIGTGTSLDVPSAWLFTDRVPKGLPGWVRTVAVGGPSRNVGFVSLAKEDLANGSQAWKSVVKNFSRKRREGAVAEYADGRRSLGTKPLALEPGDAEELSWVVPADAPWRTLEWRIEPPDELPADDRLFLLRGSAAFRVALPAEAPESLRRAFLSIPRVEVVEWTGEKAPDPCDLAVGGPGVGGASPTVVWDVGGPAYRPRSVRALPEGELGRLLSFEGVRVEEAHALAEEGGTALAVAQDPEGRDRPLILRNGDSIRIGLRLEKTDWPLHPSFPVFWAALVEELGGRRAGFGFVRTGSPVWRTGFHPSAEQPRVAANLLDPGQSENSGDAVPLPPAGGFISPGRRIHSLGGYPLAVSLLLFLAAWFLERRGR